jgi:hypothetical protein
MALPPALEPGNGEFPESTEAGGKNKKAGAGNPAPAETEARFSSYSQTIPGKR